MGKTNCRCTAAPYAIATRQINLNGYNLFTDSFNSSDTNQSTDGLYDPIKAGDGGDVASESGIFNSINVGTVEIWGKLETALPFAITLGPESSIGSTAWHLASQLGIEPGYHETNFVWAFPDVAPFFLGLFPASGTYDGVFYQYVLNLGDYELASLTMSGSQKMLVTSTARLKIAGNVSLSGNASILILPSASLQLYVAGSTANIRGNGVINQGMVRNFLYLGTGGNTAVNFRVSSPLKGSIYAPEATCAITSAGSNVAEVHGAIVAKTVELGANLQLHVDEAP